MFIRVIDRTKYTKVIDRTKYTKDFGFNLSWNFWVIEFKYIFNQKNKKKEFKDIK